MAEPVGLPVQIVRRRRTHYLFTITFSLFTCRRSPHLAFPFEGKVSAEPTDEVFFQWRIKIAPIHILRLPDRRVRRKPLQAERASLFPTERGANPYHAYGKRQSTGFVCTFDTGLPQLPYPQVRRFASKKRL